MSLATPDAPKASPRQRQSRSTRSVTLEVETSLRTQSGQVVTIVCKDRIFTLDTIQSIWSANKVDTYCYGEEATDSQHPAVSDFDEYRDQKARDFAKSLFDHEVKKVICLGQNVLKILVPTKPQKHSCVNELLDAIYEDIKKYFAVDHVTVVKKKQPSYR